MTDDQAFEYTLKKMKELNYPTPMHSKGNLLKIEFSKITYTFHKGVVTIIRKHGFSRTFPIKDDFESLIYVFLIRFRNEV